MVPCSIKKWTSLECPGCGGQRAVYAILKGGFREAFFYNQLIYFYLIVIGYLYVFFVEKYIVRDQKFENKIILSNKFAYLFLAVIIIFMIIRNI